LTQYTTRSDEIATQSRELSEALKAVRAEIDTLNRERDTLNNEIQISSGRLSSLEALQQAALGKDDNKALSTWLNSEGYGEAQHLGEQLQVTPDWRLAAETVLSDALQAVSVERFPATNDWPTGAYLLFSQGAINSDASTTLTPLSQHFSNPAVVGSLLSDIYCAASLSEMLSCQPQLKPHESIVTPEGFWCGPDWIRSPSKASSEEGVIARQEAIAELCTKIDTLREQRDAQEKNLQIAKATAQETEQQLSALSSERHEVDKTLGETKSKRASVQSKLEQQQKRFAQIEDEHRVIHDNIHDAERKMETMRSELETVVEQMSNFSSQKETLESEKDARLCAVQETRQKMKAAVDTAHEIELSWQSLTNECQSLRQAIARAQQQQSTISDRLSQLQLSVDENASPLENLETRLQSCLETKLKAEAQLTKARDSFGEAEQMLESTEKETAALQKRLSELSEKLQALRMEQQAAQVRREGYEAALAKLGKVPDDTLKTIDPQANAEGWQARIEKLANRMSRLEPINLAAIDEYAQQSERKTYLDAQNDDLMEAIAVLEEAIDKIDKETRERFKETFDQVNENFQALFPRLFGGGRAALRLTDDDILDSGVSVMAQPPGKRNSLIQQLSGGEKALVAVSLVFAIFQLNPAPFYKQTLTVYSKTKN
jgi:chromosome segregation protein